MDTAHNLRSYQKRRTTNFREDETKLLIQLWGSPQIQNKLYLTHRKAPVMKILAAHMQERGFYRTPDEIKTRIRNLKCLYHRIKRSMQSGTGLCSVDPDWPHFKAMDEILSKQSSKKDIYKTNIFEGPRCEDIKQEIDDDIDITDDMDYSFTGSDYEEEATQMPTLTPAPQPQKDSPLRKEEERTVPKILPKPTAALLSNPPANVRPNAAPSIPFPLLILNGVAQQSQDKGGLNLAGNHDVNKLKAGADVNGVLKELLDVQKESLEVNRQRLEMEKQKFEFERLVGTQLLTLVPMLGGLLQRIAFPTNSDGLPVASSNSGSNGGGGGMKNGRKRTSSDSGFDILKDSKILRNVLEQGIKKYMLADQGNNVDNESENEDSGIQNDENSNSSSK